VTPQHRVPDARQTYLPPPPEARPAAYPPGQPPEATDREVFKDYVQGVRKPPPPQRLQPFVTPIPEPEKKAKPPTVEPWGESVKAALKAVLLLVLVAIPVVYLCLSYYFHSWSPPGWLH
jgi:hypothetical protein